MRLLGHRVPRSTIIYGVPYILGLRGKLRLGERVMITSNPALYAHGLFGRCGFTAMPGALIEIGDDSFVGGSFFFAQERISIGKRTQIASGCRIWDHDGHSPDVVPRDYNVDHGKVRPVTIGDDVWLGCDVIVGKGVTIGNGSVIGAKSLVTHDVPPGVLAAGIPAQVIRPLRLGETGEA